MRLHLTIYELMSTIENESGNGLRIKHTKLEVNWNIFKLILTYCKRLSSITFLGEQHKNEIRLHGFYHVEHFLIKITNSPFLWSQKNPPLLEVKKSWYTSERNARMWLWSVLQLDLQNLSSFGVSTDSLFKTKQTIDSLVSTADLYWQR